MLSPIIAKKEEDFKILFDNPKDLEGIIETDEVNEHQNELINRQAMGFKSLLSGMKYNHKFLT